MTTTRQRVQVAKDRALDELTEIHEDANGYWNFDRRTKKRVQAIARFLHMPDGDGGTLAAAERLDFINGEEGMFFEKEA